MDTRLLCHPLGIKMGWLAAYGARALSWCLQRRLERELHPPDVSADERHFLHGGSDWHQQWRPPLLDHFTFTPSL